MNRLIIFDSASPAVNYINVRSDPNLIFLI